MIREATTDDYKELIVIAKKVFDNCDHSGTTWNEAYVKQSFMRMVMFGFSKVVEHEGTIVGMMFGTLATNQWGSICAYDQITFSTRETHKLLREFAWWAEDNGAETVCVTNISGNDRYNKLIKKMGFTTESNTFIKEI